MIKPFLSIKLISSLLSSICFNSFIKEQYRLFIFFNNSNEKYYLASADWISRNLMNRIECAFPIYDHDLQKILRDIFDLQWNDPLKARIIDGVKDTLFKQSEKSKMKSSSQQLTYEYLKS